MAVDGAGGQHCGDRLAAILKGADIKGLMVVGMAGMAIQAGGRILGGGLGNGIGYCGAAGVVTKATIILMLDQDIVPARQVTGAAIVTDEAGLTIIGIGTEANGVTRVATVRTVVMADKISHMTGNALPVRSGGGGSRTFQGAVGSQVMTGGASAGGMDLARTNKWRG